MNVISVIVLLLIVNTKASFFDDFNGAMSSVENAFEKLLYDVVTDVKTTVHCTILAMEQVLAINGIGTKPLPNKNCNEYDNNDNVDIKVKNVNRNSYSANNFSNEIDSTISKVNKSLSHILDNNGHERLKDVKTVLENESNRLKEVSYLLRKELDKISQRMKKEFRNVDIDSDKTSLESVWNDMKILYEVEKNDKNVSEEIGEVLNEALIVLHVDTVNEVKTDGEKINVIMRELEKESNNNNIPNNTINHELLQLEGVQSSLQNNLGHKLIPEETPESFKDIAKEVDDCITDKSSSLETSKLSSDNNTRIIQTDNEESQSFDANLDDLSSFAEINSEDNNTKAIDEAMDIMNAGAQTQAVFDRFFAEEQGTNLFDNSELLNFEK